MKHATRRGLEQVMQLVLPLLAQWELLPLDLMGLGTWSAVTETRKGQTKQQQQQQQGRVARLHCHRVTKQE